MKLNINAVVFWAFLSLLFHVFGGNWLVGLVIGLGLSLLVAWLGLSNNP